MDREPFYPLLVVLGRKIQYPFYAWSYILFLASDGIEGCTQIREVGREGVFHARARCLRKTVIESLAFIVHVFGCRSFPVSISSGCGGSRKSASLKARGWKLQPGASLSSRIQIEAQIGQRFSCPARASAIQRLACVRLALKGRSLRYLYA